MLLALPPELLAAILACLGPHALLAAAAASRLLARIVAASSRLQYTIALAKHRLLDIHPAAQHPPYAARLRLLTDRESAWSSLRWKARHTLKLPPTGSVYEFVGGIYGNGREDDNRITASISFLELPTSASDPARPLRTWTHPMGDVTIIDFTMDPSQDLLVLVAVAPLDSKFIYHLHLRTISTNEPHPRAPLPILHCLDRHPSNPPHHELFAAVRVQVSGDLVGLLIKEAPDPIGAHLQIWNWENDPYYPCSMSSQHGIDDFTFLSRSAFLTVLPVGQFVVYSFPDPLVSPDPPAKPSCEPVKRYMYEFPELTNGYMYWYISMSCNPAPGYVPCQGDRAMNPFPNSSSTPTPGNTNPHRHLHDPTKQLYYPLPDERIHACCIYIFNPNHQPTNLTGNNNNGNPTNLHHATSTAAATGGPTQNVPINPNFLTDDELDEENQQVHSFVFFMNLKNLLDPPDEWFLRQDKKKTTTTTTKMDDSHSCLSGTGHSDNTAGISLESSLNALKRRQEEQELHDAKAGGNGHEKGKKKMKTGNSSSSLSVEVPIDGSPTRSNGIVTRSKNLLSSSSNSMMATTTTGHTRASSSTPLTYPPFPTFSSPLTTIGSLFDAENISRTSSLDEVEDIIMATPESPLPSTSSSTKPPKGRNISSCSNNTILPYPNAIASTSSSPSPSSTSILHTTTSPNKTRSTSTPPAYTTHNHNHSNASCSTWRNNAHHHQDVKFPGGFAPSTSTSTSSFSSSMQTLPFPYNSSSSFSANHEQSQNTTNRQPKQENNNSFPSASSSSSSSADTLKKLQETPVPWEVWGPSSTRWFEECLSTDWQHAIYGLRTVESVSVRERDRMRFAERRWRDAHGAASTAYQEAARQKEQKERSVDDTKGNKGKGKAEERGDLPSDDDNEQGVSGKDKGKDLIKGGMLGSDNDDEIFQQDLVDQGRNDDRTKLKGDKNPDFIHVAAPNNATTGPSITATTTYPTLSHSSQNTINGTGTMNGIQTTMTSAAPSSSSSNGLPVRLRPRRFLRVRDFNPYSLRQAEAEVETERTKMKISNGDWRLVGKGKGKQREIYSSFSPLPISPTTTADMMPLPSTSAYSYPYPIHLSVNSNFSNYSALSSTPLARSSASNLMMNGAMTDLVQWGKRRVVREPSVTPVRGVFKRDVVSWLPYTEVVSEETFEVTDVMMDDCRLLLLKRGQMGKLESVEVLMM